VYLVLASSTTFSPTSTAKPAKFALARCTSHVVAAFSQFDHLIALGTTLECTVVESTQDKLSCLVSLARALWARERQSLQVWAKQAEHVISCLELASRANGREQVGRAQ